MKTVISHKGQTSFQTECSSKLERLARENQDALCVKLKKNYEQGCVPSSMEHWGMDWFDLSSQTEAASKLTSIIILTHNQLEYTKKCIESIFQSTETPFELIVVDNGSSDGSVAYLESDVRGWRRTEDGGQGRRKSRITIIKNKENLGFAVGNNQGMAEAKGEYILLLDNDVVVTPGWLSRMISCAERQKEIGIVGPMTNFAPGPQLDFSVAYDTERLVGLNEYAEDVAINNFHKRRRVLRVVAFCMLIKRSVVNMIGGMDDRYGPGNFEDDDFSLRTALSGFQSWIAQDCYIHHFGNRTFVGEGIDYNESLHRNRELFKKKWNMSHSMLYGSSYNLSQIGRKIFNRTMDYVPLDGKKISGPIDKKGGWSNVLFSKNREESIEVSIIISAANQGKYLKRCIESVQKHTFKSYEVIFVDNGCDGTTLKWIRQCVKNQSNYRLIKARKKAGFGSCFNMGMKVSSGEYIILLRDYLIVGDGWLDSMLGCINNAEDAGIVGPMTNGKDVGIQCVTDADHVKVHQLEEYAETFLRRNQHRRVGSREIAGFCMLFRRSLVERIGTFDEELEQGTEFVDYCLRATLEGYKNLIAGDVFVLCGDFPMQGNKRPFKHKWHGIDMRSFKGERIAALDAIGIAEDLYHREKTEEAVTALIDGIKDGPDEKIIYHRLAGMLIDCKRFKEGFEAINAIPGDKGNDPKTFELAGYCKEGMESYDEADRLVEGALSLSPSSASALNLKGMLSYKEGDKATAEGFFRRAINSDPGYGDAYTNMGVLAWEIGRKANALELLEKGCILSPAIEDNVTAYHSAILEISEFERAENVFREAKTLYPQNRRISFLLIDILIRQEKYELAVREIREAMITFGLSDGILSAAQAVLDKLKAQVTAKVRKKPALSLCMIVKDKEDCLAKCLMSIMPVVDEIIIVDTGSTDRTKEIAKVFGGKIYDFMWRDDFSEARNFSLSKAAGEWIFVLDAHEVISQSDCKRLARIVKNDVDRPAAYTVATRNYVEAVHPTGWICNNGQYSDEEHGAGWYSSGKVRLFTNDNRIRFEAPNHERIEPSLKKLGINTKECDIHVHHYGQLDKDCDIAERGIFPLKKHFSKGKSFLSSRMSVHENRRSNSPLSATSGPGITAMNQPYRHSPKVIILCGPSGAGKTTVASDIAEDSGYAYISQDGVRGAIATATGLTWRELSDPKHENLYRDEFCKRIKAIRYNNIIVEGAIITQPFVLNPLLFALNSIYGEYLLMKPVFLLPPLNVHYRQWSERNAVRVQQYMEEKCRPKPDLKLLQGLAQNICVHFDGFPVPPKGFEVVQNADSIKTWTEQVRDMEHPALPREHKECVSYIAESASKQPVFYQTVEVYGKRIITGQTQSFRTWENFASLDLHWSGKKVLEIECNTGYFLFRAAERGGICTGYDRDEESLRIAEALARYTRIPLTLCNRNVEDGIDGEYDFILALNMLHYVSNLPATIHEMCAHARTLLLEVGKSQVDEIVASAVHSRFTLTRVKDSHRRKSSIGPCVILRLDKDGDHEADGLLQR
jgi:GT2 family glycosyltransferase/Flp pilus assembly protein TadD/cytidylate kinase/SAM-dependent methyltransferase